jgi:hypothetical protein
MIVKFRFSISGTRRSSDYVPKRRRLARRLRSERDNDHQGRRWEMIKVVCVAAVIGVLFFLASCASKHEPPSVIYPSTSEDPRNYSPNPYNH